MPAQNLPWVLGLASVVAVSAWPIPAASSTPAITPIVGKMPLGDPAEPSETATADTLQAGDAEIHPERVALGTQTVRSWQVTGDERTINSTTVQTIARGTEGVEDVLVIETLHWSAAGDTTRTRCIVRASDLSLLHLRIQGERDSTAVTATPYRATGWVALPGQPVRLLDASLPHPVLPSDGQIPWLLAALPLRPGATLVLKRFSPFDGGEIERSLRVEAAEAVTVAETRFDCWRIDGGVLGPPGYRVTRWVDRATGRVVQSALRGPAGPGNGGPRRCHADARAGGPQAPPGTTRRTPAGLGALVTANAPAGLLVPALDRAPAGARRGDRGGPCAGRASAGCAAATDVVSRHSTTCTTLRGGWGERRRRAGPPAGPPGTPKLPPCPDAGCRVSLDGPRRPSRARRTPLSAAFPHA